MEDTGRTSDSNVALKIIGKERWILWGENEHRVATIGKRPNPVGLGEHWYMVVGKDGNVRAYNHPNWERKTKNGDITPEQIVALFEMDENGSWSVASFMPNGISGEENVRVRREADTDTVTPAADDALACSLENPEICEACQ